MIFAALLSVSVISLMEVHALVCAFSCRWNTEGVINLKDHDKTLCVL